MNDLGVVYIQVDSTDIEASDHFLVWLEFRTTKCIKKGKCDQEMVFR